MKSFSNYLIESNKTNYVVCFYSDKANKYPLYKKEYSCNQIWEVIARLIHLLSFENSIIKREAANGKYAYIRIFRMINGRYQKSPEFETTLKDFIEQSKIKLTEEPEMNYIAYFYKDRNKAYDDFERFKEKQLDTVIKKLVKLFSATYGMAELMYRRKALKGIWHHIRIYKTTNHVDCDPKPAVDMPMMEFFTKYGIPLRENLEEGVFDIPGNVMSVISKFKGNLRKNIQMPMWYRKTYLSQGVSTDTTSATFDFGHCSITLHRDLEVPYKKVWDKDRKDYVVDTAYSMKELERAVRDGKVEPVAFWRLAYFSIGKNMTQMDFALTKKIAQKSGISSYFIQEFGKNPDIALKDFLQFCKDTKEITVDLILNKFAELVKKNNITYDLD